MSLSDLEDNLVSASANFSLSGDYTASVSLSNQAGQFYSGCYDTCVPLVYKFTTTNTYGADLAGTPGDDLYSTNPTWIAGLIATYDESEDITSSSMSLSLSSYFSRLNQTPLYTAVYSGTLPEIIDTVLSVYTGVPTALYDNDLTSTYTLSTRVSGQSAWTELKSLAQVAGGTMYVQVGGKLEFGPWKDQNSSVDLVIPPEWSIRVQKKSVGPQNTYLIQGTGANTAVAASGYKIVTDARIANNNTGFGSIPGSYKSRVISGIGNDRPKVELGNLTTGDTDVKNIELTSAAVDLVTKVNTTTGFAEVIVKKKDGSYVTSELIDMMATGVLRPSREEGTTFEDSVRDVINFTYGRLATEEAIKEAVNDRRKKRADAAAKGIKRDLQEYKQQREARRNIESYGTSLPETFSVSRVINPPVTPTSNLVGGPAGGPGQKNTRRANYVGTKVNPGSNQLTAVSVDLVDYNQTGICGFSDESISNKYADTPEKVVAILKRRYQELFLDNNTLTVECPYIADIRLNQVIQFTTMGTSELAPRVVTGLVVGISVNYDAAPSLSMSLTVQDFSCLDGTRELFSGNLIAARNGGYQSVSPYFTIGQNSPTEIVNFQDLTLFIASDAAGTPACTYNHADATVGDEYYFQCKIRKVFPIASIHPVGAGFGEVFPITYINSQTGSQSILNTGTENAFSDIWTCTGSSFTIQFSLAGCPEPVGFLVSDWSLRKLTTI